MRNTVISKAITAVIICSGASSAGFIGTAHASPLSRRQPIVTSLTPNRSNSSRNPLATTSARAKLGTKPKPADSAQVSGEQVSTTKTSPKTLQEITVTGSLIPTAELETATPVITIDTQQMKRQGYTNINQALRAMPLATGAVSGEQTGAGFGFTPTSHMISMMGLSPEFTLIMIDGHPIADSPLLADGTTSFQDIASIPDAAIQQVQVVPGNQSSIYGSAAIAGVVNVILKRHVHGLELNYQVGQYSDGGGLGQRLQAIGGFSHHKLSLTYALQYQHQQPIFYYQRSLTASSFSNPNPYLRGQPVTLWSVLDESLSPQGVDLDPSGCGTLSALYGGTVRQFTVLQPGNAPNTFVPTGGQACGSPYGDADETLKTKSNSANGYVRSEYRINANAKLYGSLLYNYRSDFTSAGPSGVNGWEPNFNANYNGGLAGVILNANTNTFQAPVYSFAPGMDGSSPPAYSTTYVNRTFDFTGGIKGRLPTTNWRYDAFYTRSQDNLNMNTILPMTDRVDAYFGNLVLGPELGTTSGGIPIYRPDYSKFFEQYTPDVYKSFLGTLSLPQETYIQSVNLQVNNTDLFTLPAGNVGYAGILQYSRQDWVVPTSPIVTSHAVYGYNTSSGGGQRNGYALASEVRVPIFKHLTADVSARFDQFADDGGGSHGRPTYKFAFAYRPTNTLLFRANYATAFRVPDMGESFLGPSSFGTGVTDDYQCAKLFPGTPSSQCPSLSSNAVNPGLTVQQIANPNLKPITAKSWGGGIVWSPTAQFSIKADYYDVRLRNEVEYQDLQTLATQDSECLLGQIAQSSTVCQTAEAAIKRAPADAPIPLMITGASIEPVNVGKERINGILSSVNYMVNAGRFGNFDFNVQYNVTLRHTIQLTPASDVLHLMHDPFSDVEFSQGGVANGPEFKSIVTGTVTWNFHQWVSALTVSRYGELPNFATTSSPSNYGNVDAGNLPAWLLYNFTTHYQISRKLGVSLILNNLTDAMPPRDLTHDVWPYYRNGNYNVYGRSYFLDVDYRF